MTRTPSLSHPFLLGFDDIERALDRVAKGASEGYPPYNIERLTRTEDEPDRLRITLAVAGVAREQLEITLEENQHTIRGRQGDDKNRQVLHRRPSVPAQLPAGRRNAGSRRRSVEWPARD